MVRSNPACGIPLEQSIPPISSWLPFTEDQDEADYVYTFLCDLIEKYVSFCSSFFLSPHISTGSDQ